MHVLLSEASTHNPLDVGAELGVKEANDIGIDGAIEHERPQRHLDSNTQLLLARLGLLKHSKTSWTGTVMFSSTHELQCLISLTIKSTLWAVYKIVPHDHDMYAEFKLVF